MINIVVTSKPVDGLFYYSYEYCDLLNKAGINAQVIVICHKNYSVTDYINVITNKYIHCKNLVFDRFIPNKSDVTLVMGRSMITLSWLDYNSYSLEQQSSLLRLFSANIISVYSENHHTEYPKAIEFYNPTQIVDLCDREVYPNGVGEHFEKRINFEIYKPYTQDIQFKYLFFGTNDKYYAAAENLIDKYPDYGILTYDADYVNVSNNNIYVPVPNIIGIFDTYVYTKTTFDPAPRIIQECKYYNKNILYERDKAIVDGGSVYWRREIQKPNISPLIDGLEEIL